jgi:hypothetical protein
MDSGPGLRPGADVRRLLAGGPGWLSGTLSGRIQPTGLAEVITYRHLPAPPAAPPPCRRAARRIGRRPPRLIGPHERMTWSQAGRIARSRGGVMTDGEHEARRSGMLMVLMVYIWP